MDARFIRHTVLHFQKEDGSPRLGPHRAHRQNYKALEIVCTLANLQSLELWIGEVEKGWNMNGKQFLDAIRSRLASDEGEKYVFLPTAVGRVAELYKQPGEPQEPPKAAITASFIRVWNLCSNEDYSGGKQLLIAFDHGVEDTADVARSSKFGDVPLDVVNMSHTR